MIIPTYKKDIAMKNILVIHSSLQGDDGNSTKAANQYIASIESKESVAIEQIDLMALSLPHLTKEEMQAWAQAPESRTDTQVKLASYSQDFISAMQKADEVVLAVPMYNFGIPSVLKAFFDRIARAGITFRYTENGPEGLLTGNVATILAARGGKYKGTELDTQSAYLKNFLAFIGIKSLNFIYIEGLAMGEESANLAWQKFSEEIIELNELAVD
jgi:FMN-dependent NADH-azoreductase